MHPSSDTVLGIAPLSHPSQYPPSPFCRQLGLEQVQWPVMMLFMLLFLYIIWTQVLRKFTTTPLPCTWSGGEEMKGLFCFGPFFYKLWFMDAVCYLPPHPPPHDTLKWLTLLPIWIPYTTCSVTVTEVCGGEKKKQCIGFCYVNKS